MHFFKKKKEWLKIASAEHSIGFNKGHPYPPCFTGWVSEQQSPAAPPKGEVETRQRPWEPQHTPATQPRLSPKWIPKWWGNSFINCCFGGRLLVCSNMFQRYMLENSLKHNVSEMSCQFRSMVTLENGNFLVLFENNGSPTSSST